MSCRPNIQKNSSETVREPRDSAEWDRNLWLIEKRQLAQVSRQLEHMREKLELRFAEGTLGLETEPKSEHYTSSPAPVFPVLQSSLLPEKIGDIELVPDAIVVLFHEWGFRYFI